MTKERTRLYKYKLADGTIKTSMRTKGYSSQKDQLNRTIFDLKTKTKYLEKQLQDKDDLQKEETNHYKTLIEEKDKLIHQLQENQNTNNQECEDCQYKNLYIASLEEKDKKLQQHIGDLKNKNFQDYYAWLNQEAILSQQTQSLETQIMVLNDININKNKPKKLTNSRKTLRSRKEY